MRYLTLLTFLLYLNSPVTHGQEMNNASLKEIISTVADSLAGEDGQWRFKIGEMWMVCFTDSSHNRMRIITPIIEVAEMHGDEMEKCMTANFHTALDVKYCIADGILWSAFIHPLKELSYKQVLDALGQVFSASSTFGTNYTSTELIFPSKKPKPVPKKQSKS